MSYTSKRGNVRSVDALLREIRIIENACSDKSLERDKGISEASNSKY